MLSPIHKATVLSSLLSVLGLINGVKQTCPDQKNLNTRTIKKKKQRIKNKINSLRSDFFKLTGNLRELTRTKKTKKNIKNIKRNY